jgi:hypothetical protein
MTNRMDIVTSRQGSDGKTYFTKIGVAFQNRNGGWSMAFEALPVPSINDKGILECRALLMPPRDRDAPSPGTNPDVRQKFGGPTGGGVYDLSDDVPF